MTTISADFGFIDYAAFGLAPDDLRSLRALAPLWRDVLNKAGVRYSGSTGFNAFLAQSVELPLRIDDIVWQGEWMRAWQRLSAQGFSLADMFSFFNGAMADCEADLFGDAVQISRLQLALFGILRRSVVAAISCAIELGEQSQQLGSGIPGELAAMRRLRQACALGESLAVLSVSMVSRRALSHLTAGEMQDLPGLLAERLTSVLRPQDLVFVGHEGEWLLILPDARSMVQPALAATQIRRVFDQPIVLLSGRGVTLEVVVGAAMMPEHGRDEEEVIRAARLARASLQQSKEPFAIFDAAMQEDWQQRQRLSEELRDALRSEILQLHLQPQVDTEADACVGAELLLRWQRKDGSWVAPPVIMEMIEENGWRGLFTEWLIRTALRTGANLADAGVQIDLSLNLTAGDLLDSDLPELVAQCLATWRLPAGRFTFELTESAMMADRERGLVVMHRLRDLGINLALDDFGTGYSSLSYLATLPLNEIKIDRSFVVDMWRSLENLRIVRTIIDLTHDLGMRSLAEGVEEPVQRDQLLALGCNRLQGFLYGRAMPLPDFINWFRQRQP